MKTCRWLWAGTIIMLLSPLVGNASNVEGQVVFASTGRPSPYVAIRLYSASRGPSEFAYSGINGKFYMKNVPAGDYQLEVWRGGKVVVSTTVSIHEPSTSLPPTRIP